MDNGLASIFLFMSCTDTHYEFSATVSLCETVLTFDLMSFAVVVVNFDFAG